MIRVKRVYEKPAKEDGFRLLVDRLWPRGLTKERAEFEKRYRKELAEKKDLLNEIRKLESGHKLVTLLYGRNDEKQNQAVVLADVLKRKR
jgi:uncharacterized protein YeaO (DUF488 family)